MRLCVTIVVHTSVHSVEVDVTDEAYGGGCCCDGNPGSLVHCQVIQVGEACWLVEGRI